ncbi:MAG: transglutaminase domain-containing protein [Clostridia bacterium]|nr:transglutaminase domain-containing protein [Clostridia bacterium]
MKRIVTFVIAFMLVMSSQVFAASQSKQIGIEIENRALGIVSAYYENETDQRLKILVEKMGEKYYYDLNNTGKLENFPLQLGEGNYTVTLFENVSTNLYKKILSKSFFVDFNEANLTYLQSVQGIDWNGAILAIGTAGELIKDKSTDLEKVKAIYNYVVANVQYDYEKVNSITPEYLPDIDQTLRLKKGICYDFASTLAGMLRSVGIPTKLVKGYTANINAYHAWNEIYIDGVWVVVDASYDSQMKAINKPYDMIKASSLYDKKYEF